MSRRLISIPNETTVVIGGLIRDDKSTTIKKVPLFGDFPIVGGLFRVDGDRTEKTNLLLLITSHVLTTQEALEKITELKEQQTLQTGSNIEEELSFLF
jgi:general secretion pathway protein D